MKEIFPETDLICDIKRNPRDAVNVRGRGS